MLVKIIPVIPAWERPMLPIGDGKWVVSDLNDVYRKIIRHNRRMRRLIEMNEKPYVWVRDALAVQKACDQLFEMLDQRYRKIS
jgi:DNA-directed RNA polymerase beta' subunit